MKKKLFYSLLALTLLFSFSCSRDRDEQPSNSTKQKLIGKWYFGDPAIYGTTGENHSFTFSNDNVVTYRFGSQTTYFENGSYTVDGDKLTMVYPDNVVVTYVQKVVFSGDSKVEFRPTGNPNEDAYEGDYYKGN